MHLLNTNEWVIYLDANQTICRLPLNHVTENYGDLRKTPLYFAISNGDTTCTEMLLAAGARTDLDPLPCILVAMRAERCAAVAPRVVGCIDKVALESSRMPLSALFPGMTLCSCCCPMEQRWIVTSRWYTTRGSPQPCSTAWGTLSCWGCCSIMDIRLASKSTNWLEPNCSSSVFLSSQSTEIAPKGLL